MVIQLEVQICFQLETLLDFLNFQLSRAISFFFCLMQFEQGSVTCHKMSYLIQKGRAGRSQLGTQITLLVKLKKTRNTWDTAVTVDKWKNTISTIGSKPLSNNPQMFSQRRLSCLQASGFFQDSTTVKQIDSQHLHPVFSLTSSEPSAVFPRYMPLLPSFLCGFSLLCAFIQCTTWYTVIDES